MALVYTPTTTWPRKMLDFYKDVLTKDGLHYTFKAGRTSERLREPTRPDPHYRPLLVKPYYKGYTLRFFLFAGKKEGETYIGSDWRNPFEVWQCRVIVKDGSAYTQEHQYDWTYVSEIELGSVYTMALRTDDQVYFKMSCNEKGFNSAYMRYITDYYDYKLWEDSGNHTYLSMHIYNESANPTPDLGTNLYLEDLLLSLGTTYGSYVVVYKENAESVEVHVKNRFKTIVFIFYTDGKLRNNDIFYCVVRITAYGFAVSMSFDPKPQFHAVNDPKIIEYSLSVLHCYFTGGVIKNAHITTF